MIIDIDIDTSLKTAKARGEIRGDKVATFVLKGYATYVTADSRVQVMLDGRVLAEGSEVEVDGEDGVCDVDMRTDAMRRLACRMHMPSQVGAEIVIDHGDDASFGPPCKGPCIILLNWKEEPGGGGGGVEPAKGAVPITEIDDLPARFRETDMRRKINEIARVISGRVVMLAAMLAPFSPFAAGVNVTKATKGDIYNDEKIVTDVTFDGSGIVDSLSPATNYVDYVMKTARAEVSNEVGAASIASTNYVDEAKDELSADIASARTSAVSDAKAYTDSATNSIVFPVVDLSEYAKMTWVQSLGFVTSAALAPYATKTWVEGKGYLTSASLSQYATKTWVDGRGFLTSTDLAPYATTEYVDDKDALSRTWADNRFATRAYADSLNRGLVAVNDRFDEFAIMAADTNMAQRLWAYDGSAMMDATGVVWDVTWSEPARYVSLSNGLVYTQTSASTWEANGVVTNLAGDVGVGVLDSDSGMEGQFKFYVKTVPGDYAVSDTFGTGFVSFGGAFSMPADAFTNQPVRVPSFTYRNRFAWITEAGGGSAKPFIGQTFDFTDNRVLYTALSNIVIQLGGTVVNFPDFQ